MNIRAFSSHLKAQKFIMSIDQGTTSTRALLIPANSSKDSVQGLHVVASHQEELTQYTEKPGWVSHNPVEIYKTVLKCIEGVMQKNGITKDQIECVGITNQRETTVAWDKVTGKPIQNAVVWLDKRTESTVEDLLLQADNDQFKYSKTTGLPISTYFSGVKMKWFMSDKNDNQKDILKAISDDRLYFGTVDSWLIYCLTGKHKFVTDATNASRTMLMNISTLEWDSNMLDTFNIPRSSLPKIIKESSSDFGIIAEEVLRGVPITGVMGDQQSACLGHVLREGEVKCTYGTGCFILCNSGENLVYSKNGLLSTVLWKLSKEQNVTYGLEGAVE